MQQDFNKGPMSERHKGMVRMRTITNYGMGIILVAFGFFFMFPTETTYQYFHRKYDQDMLNVLAVMCWIYGAFRIYRGYQKNYFRD